MRAKFIEFAKNKKSHPGVKYEWSECVVKRGRQTFAIFGSIAYEVTPLKFDEPGTGRLCVPINGRYLAQFPDEGNCGVMGLYILSARQTKPYGDGNQIVGPSFTPCGWLHTSELKLTDDEIRQNISNDIARGENVYFPKPAGWA